MTQISAPASINLIGKRNTSAHVVSRAMYATCIVFAVIILAILAIVTGYLLFIGISNFIWHDGGWGQIFTHWHGSLSFFYREPISDRKDALFPGGMANGVLGTIVLIGLASIVGIPLGMLCGVYLAEYDQKSFLTAPVRFVADVVAGVPSIVVGILFYELLVLPFHRNSAWAGAAALAFIMIPIIARTTEEMLRLVPNSYREASMGLGGTKAGTIMRVVIPAALGSIVTGVMLAVARIAGETAPLLFTVVGNNSITWNLNDRFPALTVQVYNYTNRNTPEEKLLAWGGILVLISLIFVLNLAIRYATRQRGGGAH